MSEMKLEYPRGISGDDIAVDNPYRSRIIFGIKEVTPVEFSNAVDGGTGEQSFEDMLGSLGDFLFNQTFGRFIAQADDIEKQNQKTNDYIKDAQTQIRNSRVGRYKFTSKKVRDIILYTPAAIQLDDRLDYNTGAAIGFGGNALLNTVDQGIGAGIKAAVGAAAIGVSDFANIVAGNEVGRVAAVRASQGLIGRNLVPDTIQNAVSLAAQVTINPNLRTLFKGVQVRTFTLNFQFIPSDPDEAKTVEAIVDQFRFSAYPSTRGLGAYGFHFPDRFSVAIETHNKFGQWSKVKPRFIESYLTGISVTSNPTASVYHEDGQAVQTNLTLAFAEHRALTRSDIEPNYAGVDVDVILDGDREDRQARAADVFNSIRGRS